MDFVNDPEAVSYTHLDVYKRQVVDGRQANRRQHQEHDPFKSRQHDGILSFSIAGGQRWPAGLSMGRMILCGSVARGNGASGAPSER